MRTLKFITTVLGIVGLSWLAHAQPTIDSLAVQGYMKRADGTAVSNGTYNIAYGVRQNGTTIWAKQISTTVADGLFSATLSSTGTNLTGIPAGTGMNSDFSAVTLNPALLQSSGAGSVVVRVYAVSTINGANPQFDISISGVPTAFVASVAQGVATGAVGISGIATAAKVNTSAGVADAGKLVLLDAAGLISSTMLPTTGVDGGSISTGTISTSRLDTASTSAGAGDSGKVAVLNGSGKIDSSMIPATLPASDGSALTNVVAASVAAGAVTTTGIANGSKASTSAGAADAGKIPLLNGSGLIDSTMISGLTVAQGGTGQSSNLTQGGVVYGSSTTAMASTAAGTSGQVLTSAGTGAPTWSTISQPERRAQIYLFEDFLALSAAPTYNASSMMGKALFTAATVAGGSVAQQAVASAGDLGIIRVASGTAAANVFIGFCGIPSAAGTPVFNSRFETGDSWTFEIRLQVSSVAANTGFIRFGMLGSMSTTASVPATPSSTVTSGAFFEQTAASTTVSGYSKSTGTSGGTGIATTLAASTFARWTITYDGAGTVTFYKDGTSVGTVAVAANIPSTVANCPGIQVVGGTVTRNVLIDYISYQQNTSSR